MAIFYLVLGLLCKLFFFFWQLQLEARRPRKILNNCWLLELKRAVQTGKLGTGQRSEPRQLEPGQPETGQPATKQPETGQPETGQPVTGQPEPGQPETGQLRSEPKIPRPETKSGQPQSETVKFKVYILFSRVFNALHFLNASAGSGFNWQNTLQFFIA